MRLAIVLVVAVVVSGCGGGARGAPPPPAPAVPPAAQAYAAARWIPARPTYVLAARTVADAQRAIGDVLAGFGALAGLDAAALARLSGELLAVDLLSPEALAELGVDLDGGVALFSEGLSPTLVVQLAAPARLQAFLDRQRARGLQTSSVRVDGVEVFTAARPGLPALRWAVADGWLWLHVALELPRVLGGAASGGAPGGADTAWLSSSRRPGAPAWAGDWAWALGAAGERAPPAIVGFFDARAAIASLSPRIPAAAACTNLLAPVGRLAVSFEAGPELLRGRLTLELGDAAHGLALTALPTPGHWSAAAARAPLAAQWNIDLSAVKAHLAPCAQALAIDLTPLDTYGVRTARAILQRYDPARPTGSRGAVSFDLAHRTYAAQLLDRIPGRSLIQRKRTFGPYQGYSIAIPFGGPTVEYVLDDRRALAGLGEGVLAEVLGQGPGEPGPLLAIDLAPPAMPREAWAGLLGLLDVAPDALLGWRELHLAASVDGPHLVLDVSGRRR